ncbi:MAG: glycerol acyltransferase, partial [Pseudomonas sp.]
GLGQTPAVSRSIVGNSWFWFVGAIYLTQIPAYAKYWLHGDETVVTLVLTLFSVGIAVGSLLCERLSGRKVEIGLVPFGSFGLTLFGLLWWWHSGDVPSTDVAHDWLALLGMHQAWWIMLSIVGLGVFGGFYIVPLYALIQARTAEGERARVIAANNILNALFMVVSALVTIVLLSVVELTIPQLFLVVSLLALLVCNHVSFVDALLIAGAIRRPIRFVMYYKIYNLPVLNFIFRTAGAIPIAGRSEDEATYERAFARIAAALTAGEVVCIFPEGKLTADGDIDEFKSGVTRILQETPVPVIPLALQGLWGSFFSRDPAKGLFKRLWSRVTIVAGEAVVGDLAGPEVLRERVLGLRGGRR